MGAAADLLDDCVNGITGLGKLVQLSCLLLNRLPGIVRIAVSPQSPTLRIASRDMSNSHQVPVLACQRHIPRYLICSHARICRMPVTSTA
jgi:hypothetical protein